MKQKDLVLSHLRKGTISSMEAFQLYNITSLADRIFVLRKDGWKISTKTIKSNGKSFAEYRLERQDDSSRSGQLELSDSVDVRSNWRSRGAYDES